MNIQELIRKHVLAWIDAGKHVQPDLQDTLCFLTTEVGEAIEAYMRLPGSPYFRHHPHESTELHVAVELFDVIQMACVGLDILGVDLMEVAKSKLAYGDAKRGLWYDPEADVFRPVTVGRLDVIRDYTQRMAEAAARHERRLAEFAVDMATGKDETVITIIGTGPRDQAAIDAEYDRRVAEDEEYACEHFIGEDSDDEPEPTT